MHNIYKNLKFNVVSLSCAIPVRRTAKVGAHMPTRHCGRRAPTCGWQVGSSLPCASAMRRTAKAGWAPCQPAIVGVKHRLCRAPDKCSARQRLGPTCQPGPVSVDPRPVAGRWAGLRRAPAPCGARQRLSWAPWLADGPVFAMRQTPRRTTTIVGPVGSTLCRAPRPEAHDKDRGMVRRRSKDPVPSAVQTQAPNTKVSPRLKATVGLK
jgi:hypothetical protein